MKKLLCLIIVVVSIVCIFFLKPINNYVSDTFWNIIGNQLDKEEQERITKVENNKIVQGKDTIVIWKDTFEIAHYQDGDHLSIKTEEVSESILKKVTKHKMKKKQVIYFIR